MQWMNSRVTKEELKMPSDKAKRAAAARLAGLDKQAKQSAMKKKKAMLRTKVAMGDRKTRRKAASELSSMPRQWKD